MPIDFFKQKNEIILRYIPDIGGDWIDKEFEKGKPVTIKKTFTFNQSDLVDNEEIRNDSAVALHFGPEFVYDFVFATRLKNGYYKVKNGVLIDDIDVFIDENVELAEKYFVTDLKMSIVKIVSGLTTNDFYIGGGHPFAISVEVYEDIIRQFPSYYERIKYTEARVASVLRNYLDEVKDAEKQYTSYLNNKLEVHSSGLVESFKAYEIDKYNRILARLKKILADEDSYSEKQWQSEILEIILLIYPKYILAFREVEIKKQIVGISGSKFLDFLLVDSNGNVDILEIKKPFGNAIMTKAKHRDNHIPLKELSGTVMQIEKYIYYLNRWGMHGEAAITKKYENKLPKGFLIKITNPSGIIIMGREIGLTNDQLQDFEVVKRKYKNIVDIITYDDLLRRLKFVIEQLGNNSI
ncbi:Shedu immune nuclease family protein [Niabella beijingensis]|uniref:Shedu immune nuclease family protein n=1 Tax=Niabella beijingensis TaxID=2872700 RepID=UPI001CC0E719|nr:Shedu immune nuclease family protein [Niabella beijingensis]MBZ4191722.1 DUF4263 domain-containing protein [Niabella beijingensis]